MVKRIFSLYIENELVKKIDKESKKQRRSRNFIIEEILNIYFKKKK